jgi:NAD(P)-dependent dehydrogenase (short-subunit alcohol dehydrogenase family)
MTDPRNCALKDMGVIVTGGATGIGRATVQLLAARQARVMVVDLPERLSAAEAEWSPEGDPLTLGFRCDVRKADDCDRMAE